MQPHTIFPESPQVYFSPPVYCTISAEFHAHDNLVFHSSLNVSIGAKNHQIFHYMSP